MKPVEVVMEGTVTEDGQVVVEGKPDLPPGRVRLTIQRVEDGRPAERPMFEALRRIWAEQEARGFSGGRSAQEAVAEVRAMRDEWDAHQEELEQLQDRYRAAREQRERESEPR